MVKSHILREVNLLTKSSNHYQLKVVTDLVSSSRRGAMVVLSVGEYFVVVV